MHETTPTIFAFFGEEWLAARLELLEAEKALTRRSSWRDGVRSCPGFASRRSTASRSARAQRPSPISSDLLFPLGIMNIAAMAGLTVVIFAERMFPRGERIAQGVGLALIFSGILVIVVPVTLELRLALMH